MHPVLNESIFNNESALCENDIERISVKSTDLRLAVEKVYKAEGIMAIGKSTIEGVLKDNDVTSTGNHCWLFEDIYRRLAHLEDL